MTGASVTSGRRLASAWPVRNVRVRTSRTRCTSTDAKPDISDDRIARAAESGRVPLHQAVTDEARQRSGHRVLGQPERGGDSAYGDLGLAIDQPTCAGEDLEHRPPDGPYVTSCGLGLLGETDLLPRPSVVPGRALVRRITLADHLCRGIVRVIRWATEFIDHPHRHQQASPQAHAAQPARFARLETATERVGQRAANSDPPRRFLHRHEHRPTHRALLSSTLLSASSSPDATTTPAETSGILGAEDHGRGVSHCQRNGIDRERKTDVVSFALRLGRQGRARRSLELLHAAMRDHLVRAIGRSGTTEQQRTVGNSAQPRRQPPIAAHCPRPAQPKSWRPIFSAVSSCICGVTCEYTSSVIATRAWPSIS